MKTNTVASRGTTTIGETAAGTNKGTTMGETAMVIRPRTNKATTGGETGMAGRADLTATGVIRAVLMHRPSLTTISTLAANLHRRTRVRSVGTEYAAVTRFRT